MQLPISVYFSRDVNDILAIRTNKDKYILNFVLDNVVPATLSDDPDGPTAWDLQSDLLDEQVANGVVGVGIAPHSVDVTPSIDVAMDDARIVLGLDVVPSDSIEDYNLFLDDLGAISAYAEDCGRFVSF